MNTHAGVNPLVVYGGEMANEKQLCLNCGERLAMPTVGVLPLCSECAALQKNPRGVRFEAKDDKAPQPPSEPS